MHIVGRFVSGNAKSNDYAERSCTVISIIVTFLVGIYIRFIGYKTKIPQNNDISAI